MGYDEAWTALLARPKKESRSRCRHHVVTVLRAPASFE